MEDRHEGRPVRAESSMGFFRYAFLAADGRVGLSALVVECVLGNGNRVL